MKDDEFYVGYMPEAPTRTASVIKKTLACLGVLVVSIGAILVWSQKKFPPSEFEYGITTTVDGYLFVDPVPHLAVPLGTSADGSQLYENILLVGSGKAGAKDVVAAIAHSANKTLVSSRVRLAGYLIYGDGKTILQITAEDNEKAEVSPGMPPSLHTGTSQGNLTVTGEVVDPKCYFGVMKPGEGKAHRSCAIRCISGGIPPVFHATGSTDYLILVDENFEPLNERILPEVGDEITLSGEVIVWDDWKILKVADESINGIESQRKLEEMLTAFNKGMTQCTNE